MPASHLLSFYGTTDPEDGYAERQISLHQSAAEFGGIDHQHPWNLEQLKDTEFYAEHREILDQPRGGGLWLWKPYLILDILKRIPEGDFLMYHDVGREIRRDPKVGYRFTRSIQPMIDWATANDGMFPGLYIPIYGPAKCWTKRDCFVLMDCDKEPYWSHAHVQAGINIWQNLPHVREFIAEWLSYCKDPRIISDQPNTCGKENFPEFKDHRHDQSIFTNLVIKNNLKVYGSPDDTIFKYRDINFICDQLEVDETLKKRETTLEQIAIRHNSDRVEHGYIPFYQLHMELERDRPMSLLEIRNTPDSTAEMWSDYCPGSDVVCIQTQIQNHTKTTENGSTIEYKAVEPSHRTSLEIFCLRMLKAGRSFDYIIECGSGLMRDQQLAIGILFRLLKPGGYIFIEQMETSGMQGKGDLNPAMSNSTFNQIKRINLPTLQVAGFYYTLAESKRLQAEADTAGIHWTIPGRRCIAMIKRKTKQDS